MSFDKIILWIVAFGVIIGGVDKRIGNKFGVGQKFEDGFNAMGPLAVSIAGAIIGGFQHLTGVVIIPGMDSMLAALEIVAYVVLVLIGIFPVLELIIRLLRKPLGAMGRLIGIDAVSTGGLLFTLANSVPVYSLIKDMNKKGKILNIAWLVPATAALGDHLGFTAGVNAAMITPMIVGKLSAGICAILLALLFTRNLQEKTVG